jgi:hypothetical protein
MKIFASLFVLALMFNSCDDKEYPTLSAGQAPIIGQIPASITLDKTNINSGKLTIGFTPGAYSIPVAITSEFQIAKQGTNFNPSFTVGSAIVGNETSAEFTYKELNAAFTNLGLTPGEPSTVELRLKTHASQYQQSNTGIMAVYSDVKTITVTPFEPQPSYVYAVGAFQGWDRTGGYSLVSPLDNGVYYGYINFPEAGSAFLILPDNTSSWDHKWGSDDGATLIKDGGSDIKSPGAGYYRIDADIIALTINMTPYSWGVIGDATPTGWDSDTDMTWNYETLKWEVTMTLTAGTFKLRLNNAWDVNYGITGGVVTSGGDNIPIDSAGTYLITFDEENLVIEVKKL